MHLQVYLHYLFVLCFFYIGYKTCICRRICLLLWLLVLIYQFQNMCFLLCSFVVIYQFKNVSSLIRLLPCFYLLVSRCLFIVCLLLCLFFDIYQFQDIFYFLFLIIIFQMCIFVCLIVICLFSFLFTSFKMTRINRSIHLQ